MAKFCFYHGSDPDLIDRLRDAAKFCWGAVEESALDSFRLFVAADDHESFHSDTNKLIGAISGYAQSDDGSTGFFSEVTEGNWPLGDEWTGSFAAAAYSSEKEEITLCNDVLGHFPLYYAKAGMGLIGGSSLIVLGRSLGCGPDPVGVLQRITVPYCNYGKRTMLRKVCRLLPGELLRWTAADSELRWEYDNTLCMNISDLDVKSAARQVWDCLRGETLTATKGSRELLVATSGGWDSRLILGAFSHADVGIKCLTYGSEDHYETRIARRCAEAIGASHECFPIDGKYFPSRDQIQKLVMETESANYFEWFGMIEKARDRGVKFQLLLGDLCESIDGRYMTQFSTRKARVNSFLAGLVGRREIFEEADEAAFGKWRRAEAKKITSSLLANLKYLSDELRGSKTEKEFENEIAEDLEISFARVSDNGPQFSAMYDELFIWFHRIRFLLGNQINWLSSAFRPISPGLSMRFLRLITRVHPRHRIRRRLMNAIIDLPEFDALSRIPSAQIPFVSSRSPDLIKDLLWGLRSGADQILIKRSIKRKSSNGRRRVLQSLDYVKEYRRETTVANVKGWFSGKYLESRDYVTLARKRGTLDSWPLINVDIAAPANVSMILDLCHPEPQGASDKISTVAATYR